MHFHMLLYFFFLLESCFYQADQAIVFFFNYLALFVMFSCIALKTSNLSYNREYNISWMKELTCVCVIAFTGNSFYNRSIIFLGRFLV